MPFKFASPVSLPRFTKEEFEEQHQAYVKKNGYEIHIPGFEDIIHWKIPHEPTEKELYLYRRKDVDSLGEKRFAEIKELMEQKRAKFLRMLGSPQPKITRNISSFMTAVDDVNDALGTFAFLARITAKRLPSTLGKILEGPAGWALTGAEITDMIMSLSRAPMKGRRLQHDLNHFVSSNPLSKKARLKTLNKLKRIHITKGELIEGLQTTDNMFGIGLSLGPIFGLLTDIPFGLYHHLRGEKVTITGLPEPLLAFDRFWGRLMKSAAVLWTGIDPDINESLGLSCPALNLAGQMARSILHDKSPVDIIQPLEGTQVRAPSPLHPSTRQIIQEEIGDPDSHIGWPHSDLTYAELPEIFDGNIEPILENIKRWEDAGKQDMTALVSAQNMVDSGLNVLAMIESSDAIELDYDASVMAILKLLNQNLRFPETITREQGVCFFNEINIRAKVGIELDFQELVDLARKACKLIFTTLVPARAALTAEEEEAQRKAALNPLRDWYVKALFAEWIQAAYYFEDRNKKGQLLYESRVGMRKRWLDYYGWPPYEPQKTYYFLDSYRKRLLIKLPLIKEAFTPYTPKILEL